MCKFVNRDVFGAKKRNKIREMSSAYLNDREVQFAAHLGIFIP